MQPYLYYGFGFKSEDLPEKVRQRIVRGSVEFVGFTEDDGATGDGVFYIKVSSPWDEGKEYADTKAADSELLSEFKDSATEKELDDLLQEYELTEYKEKLKFYVSVTEI